MYPFKVDTITASTQPTHQCVTRVSGYNTAHAHSAALITHRNALRSSLLSQGGVANGVVESLLHTMPVLLLLLAVRHSITSPRPQAASSISVSAQRRRPGEIEVPRLRTLKGHSIPWRPDFPAQQVPHHQPTWEAQNNTTPESHNHLPSLSPSVDWE